VRLILLILTILFAQFSLAKKDTIEVSDYLRIVPISEHSYLHISYIPYNQSLIQCNGLVYIKNGEAAVFDTPIGNEASNNLLQWIYEEKNATVTHLVVNHFHEDCASGIASFIGTGCMTISHKKTCNLAKQQDYYCAKQYFVDSLDIIVGGDLVKNYYPGPAHTVDNIVSYIPSEKILFGGCMIKSIGANQGNVADADLVAWSSTVRNVEAKFPKVKIVIPGHGDIGNKKLLKYTIRLFAQKQ
jgi:metallo-beta-lactamase class B